MRSLIFLLFLPLFAVAQIQRPIGTNLAGVVDYSTELVFTDAFKQCREWTTFNAVSAGPSCWQPANPITMDKPVIVSTRAFFAFANLFCSFSIFVLIILP